MENSIINNHMFNNIKKVKLNDNKSDVKIKLNIENKSISAHSLKSEYFAKTLNKREFKGKIENEFNYLDIILKLTYSLTDNKKSIIDLNSLKPKSFFDLIQTANKFKFNETEEMICKMFAKYFPPINKFPKSDKILSEELSTIWEIYEKSKSLELKTLSEICLNYIDQNASQVYKYFDWLLFLPQKVLIDIFKRDSFGLPEIQIFMMIKKWFGFRNNSRKDLKDLKPILNVIRFHLIDKKDFLTTVRLSGLFDKEIINKIWDSMVWIDFNQNKVQFRIRFEPNRRFNVNHYSIDKCSVPLNTFIIPKTESIVVDISLEIETLINHIEFEMSSTLFDLVYYYLEVFVSNLNKWIRVINNSKIACNATQTLFFSELQTKRFKIIATNFGDTKLMINNISYQFDNNYSNILMNINEHNQNLIPNIDSLYILHFDSFDANYYSIDDFCSIDSNIIDNEIYIEEETEYYIRLSQPIIMKDMEIGLILESKSSMNEKFRAKFKVEVCSSFGLKLISSKWKTVAENVINRTACFRIAFEKQKVILIKISGLRYCSKNNKKLPLKVSSFKVPQIV